MKKFLHSYVIPVFAYALIYLVSKTLRLREEGKDIERGLEREGKPIIYAFWHGRLFYCPYYYKTRSPHPVSHYKILVSPSVDGEIIARTLSLFGYGVARGSSYKSARRGLMELRKSVEEGFSAVLIADGSRGPAYHAQPGSLMLSKLTGRPVLPFTVSFSKHWTMKSWDKMMIPKPFSEVVIIYGAPVSVPGDCDAATLEEKRSELERTLRGITERADSYFGRK